MYIENIVVGKPIVEPSIMFASDEDDFENSSLECPHCDKDGYIKTNYVTERVLDQEIYRIEDIYVSIRKDGSIKYIYGIHSTPELNNRTSMYCSCNASEEDLELLRLR